MATFEERLRIVLETTGAKQSIKEINSLNMALKTGDLTANKKQATYIRELSKESKRFKAEYMGIMFAGMALQRSFGGLFKGMIKDYKELSKNRKAGQEIVMAFDKAEKKCRLGFKE